MLICDMLESTIKVSTSLKEELRKMKESHDTFNDYIIHLVQVKKGII